MQARLLMADRTLATGYDGIGDYHLQQDGRLRRRGQEAAAWIFAGVQILTPELFADMPNGAFSLNKVYDQAQDADTLYGAKLDGRWMHVGTPEAVPKPSGSCASAFSTANMRCIRVRSCS